MRTGQTRKYCADLLYALFPVMVLASCATTSQNAVPVSNDDVAPALPIESRKISFALSGCYGPCPIIKLNAFSTGGVEYEGVGFVAVQGRQTLTATSGQFESFEKRLEPYRPDGSVRYTAVSDCLGGYATDNPTISISWESGSGDKDTLEWYMGCWVPEFENRSDREALYYAWKELPVAELVGEDPNRNYSPPQEK